MLYFAFRLLFMDLLCARVTTVCMVVYKLEKKGNKKDVQVGWAIRFRGLVRHRQQPPRG